MQLGIVSYEMLDVSGMALASHCLERHDEARELSRLAIKTLGKTKVAEDLERAYYNHYVIMGGGTRSERAEGARMLQKAIALVQARMRKINDEKILARFRDSVPLVKAIREAAAANNAGATQGNVDPHGHCAAAGSRASVKAHRKPGSSSE